jgi:hypothetical protein
MVLCNSKPWHWGPQVTSMRFTVVDSWAARIPYTTIEVATTSKNASSRAPSTSSSATVHRCMRWVDGDTDHYRSLISLQARECDMCPWMPNCYFNVIYATINTTYCTQCFTSYTCHHEQRVFVWAKPHSLAVWKRFSKIINCRVTAAEGSLIACIMSL